MQLCIREVDKHFSMVVRSLDEQFNYTLGHENETKDVEHLLAIGRALLTDSLKSEGFFYD